MDAPRELAELLERAVELAARGVEQPPAELGIVRRACAAPARAAATARRAAAGRRRGGRARGGGARPSRPRRAGRARSAARRPGRAARPRGARSRARARPRRAAARTRLGLVAQRGVVDDRADALAVALDLGDRRGPSPAAGRSTGWPVAVDVVAGRLAPVDELQRRSPSASASASRRRRRASGALRRSIELADRAGARVARAHEADEEGARAGSRRRRSRRAPATPSDVVGHADGVAAEQQAERR